MSEGPMRRVLFVAYYFPPRGGAGVQRSLKFVKYLRRFGWEPTVLTCTYEKRSEAYDETLLGEVPEGIEVVRAASPEGFFVKLSRAGLGRAAGLVLRPDTQVLWVRKALAAARELDARKRFDVVYTSVQPWSAGLVGMRLAAERGLPWVSDFRDPWTRSVHLVWPTRRHWEADRRLEGKFLSEAARTLVVTPTMREEFLEDHPDIAAEKVRVIYNGYDEEDDAAERTEDDGKFTIAFTGKFQYDYREGGEKESAWERAKRFGTYSRRDVRLETHSPVCFLRGLADFLRRRPENRGRVRVVFAGSVGAGNEAFAGKLGLSDVVECAGYLSHAEAVRLTQSADALLLPMFSTEDAKERVAYASGKVFEYMAARRPILALTQEGDAKDLAERSGLGVAVAPRDVEAISNAIERMYDAWTRGDKRNANETFIRSFTRERLTGQLAETFDEVLRESGGRA